MLARISYLKELCVRLLQKNTGIADCFKIRVLYRNLQISHAILTLTSNFMSAEGATYGLIDVSGHVEANLTNLLGSLASITTQNPSYSNFTRFAEIINISRRKSIIERPVADENDVPRDSPTTLVIASSIAAVCILLFFVIAYLWHTHQLDSRARKLAIRLAADAENGMQCRNARSQISRACPGVAAREKRSAVSESSQEQSQYVALTQDEERNLGSECGRSSVGVSESESGDNEDTFEPAQLSTIVERARSGTKSGRGAHRKWSRSRKSCSGANMHKRNSVVTDKEILTHFASRRHSTFFI